MAKQVTPDAYPGLTDAERRQIDRVLQGWRASREAFSPQKPTAANSDESGITRRDVTVKTAP